MFRKLINTTDDPAITVLRLVLGVVFFAHGAQKTLGWFGGYGFSGTMVSSLRACTFLLLSLSWQSVRNFWGASACSSAFSAASRPSVSAATCW